MTGKKIETLMALDFEASSLSVESWPIEVGISWIEGTQIQTWSSLIRPASSWERADWSKRSEAVHGISISDLETAPTVEDVVQQLMPKIEGFILVSDAPKLETHWLERRAISLQRMLLI
ncbi:3'-5' exonuclease [Martelella sp. AMO21009]